MVEHSKQLITAAQDTLSCVDLRVQSRPPSHVSSHCSSPVDTLVYQLTDVHSQQSDDHLTSHQELLTTGPSDLLESRIVANSGRLSFQGHPLLPYIVNRALPVFSLMLPDIIQAKCDMQQHDARNCSNKKLNSVH